MAQPNIQVDGVRIEPGSGQTLTITRDATTGSIRFVDNVITGGINLRDLASLSSVAGVMVVGVSGSGAKYTTVQSAVTAVPADASLTNPYVILVMPGVYSENVTIEKAGITLVGFGRVVITASGATPTITVQASVSTTPTSLTLQNLVLVQPNAGQACVSIIGAASSTVGLNGIFIEGCTLTASGVGSYTVLADAMDYLTVRDCVSTGSSGTASLKVSQCASLNVVGGSHPAVQADYNSGGTIPSVAGSLYALVTCETGNLQSTLTGAGSLEVSRCSTGNITVYGNQSTEVTGSTVGDLSINGTHAVTLKYTSRGTAVGAGTLTETLATGSLAFAASASETASFDVARPGAVYTVGLDTGVSTASYISARTTTGFTITFSAPVTTTVYWTVAQ